MWTFHTVPRPGEFGYDTWPKDAWKYIGGVNNWGETTIDVRRGIVFVPLGSPTYDFYGADRHGANLFGTSIVALDARTGKRLWHFQLVHHDLWDLDPSAAPQLTTIRHQGRNRDVVVVTNKTGWLYVFDRVTGEPIWPIEERGRWRRARWKGRRAGRRSRIRPTRRSMSGTFGVEDISLLSLTRPTRSKAPPCGEERGHLHAHRLADTVWVPASNGGTIFSGTAADPRAGFVYLVAHENPGIVRLLRRARMPAAALPGRSGAGQVIYQQQCQVCHGPERRGTDMGVALVYETADPRTTSPPARRFDAAAIPPCWRREGADAAVPHLGSADVENLVAFSLRRRWTRAWRRPAGRSGERGAAKGRARRRS